MDLNNTFSAAGFNEKMHQGLDRSYYTDLYSKFSEFHQNEYNIFFHLLTTPLGLLGLMSLIRVITNSSTIGMAMASFYVLTLVAVEQLPLSVFFGTTALVFVIMMSSRALKLNMISSFVCIALGYGLQDLAHIITGEKTYDSTYALSGELDVSSLSTWATFFLDHCYYLLPLCVDLVIPETFIRIDPPAGMQNLYTHAYALIPLFMWTLGSYCLDSKNGFCFFPGVHYSGRVVQCQLCTDDKESRKKDLKTVRDWAIAHCPSKQTSSHWWFSDLQGSVRQAFENCAKSSIISKMMREQFSERHYCVDIVEGMNEIYVSGPAREEECFNSDQIFYSKHVDGPLGFVPFVSTYRCIVGMDKNLAISTHFPMKPLSQNATEGEVIGFDFNREIHYITKDPSKEAESDEFRVVLKLHYCMYPRVLRPLGWMMHGASVLYNKTFRALFLKTIKPHSYYEHFLSWNVIFTTSLFNYLETFVGERNMVYFILAASVSYITGNNMMFLYMTSFIHYFRYISTYYYRSETDYGSFKRDVLLFKTIALTQLGLVYLFPEFMATYVYKCDFMPFTFDAVSVLMIASGYVISILATHALGLDRTYFGSELGFCSYERTNQFPYGFIPHPMIVSQVWALLGIAKAPHVNHLLPYVIPTHIALYMTHMLQEQFDIYQKPKISDEKKLL